MANLLKLLSKTTPVLLATLTIAVVEAAPVLAQQSNDNSEQNFQNSFITRCANTATNLASRRGLSLSEEAARSSCQCFISQLQANFTPEDYRTLATNFVQRNLNRQQLAQFYNAVRPCLKPQGE